MLVIGYGLSVVTFGAVAVAIGAWMSVGIRIAHCLPQLHQPPGYAGVSMLMATVAATSWFVARVLAARSTRTAPLRFGYWLLWITAAFTVPAMLLVALPVSPAQIEAGAACGYTHFTSLVISTTVYMPLFGVLLTDLAARISSKPVWIRAMIALLANSAAWTLVVITLTPFR